ncbi:hypothetical protein M569_06521 [Genlisea aurea]|uniref:DNA topoisomerase n=1 Tax=Genlisea aurea TaxID=192259 RepID=S8CNF1_9LAMI|nr:hypothetical protein M569_06521 [Genlisea aurea]
MAVDSCDETKSMDNSDEDDGAPIIFKRSANSSAKQNSLKQEAKRPLPPKPSIQNSKAVSSSKTPNIARVRSGDLPTVKSSSVTCKPSSEKQQIKREKQIDEPSKNSGDSDDKPVVGSSSSFSPVNADKGNNASTSGHTLKTTPKSEDSDDEKPLSQRFGRGKLGAVVSPKNSHSSAENKSSLGKVVQNGSTVSDKKPSIASKKRPGDDLKSDESRIKKPKHSGTVEISAAKPQLKEEEEDDDDHVPISQRIKKTASSEKKKTPIQKSTKSPSASLRNVNKKSTKIVKKSEYSKSSKVPPGSGEGQKWTTLVHSGVIFPPPYKPHGIKMLYKGKPVDLTPEQEEVATMFAVMLETDYMNKPQFKENFMNDWRVILGKNHTIQSLEHCDFTPIYNWHLQEKEKKKQMTTEEKKALKEEKLKQEEKYMWAIVDNVKEKSDRLSANRVAFIMSGDWFWYNIIFPYVGVGNFRVEPPGLFRGRGEHPKMGKLKKRIRPSDITINIGKGAPIPECPIPGERWKEIRHDNTVTWLAYWNDPINVKEFKYVFLAASSTLKGQSDKEKYEKARLLKDYILDIRQAYTKDFTSKDPMKKQIAVATYLIDKLALRAGNEKVKTLS